MNTIVFFNVIIILFVMIVFFADIPNYTTVSRVIVARKLLRSLYEEIKRVSMQVDMLSMVFETDLIKNEPKYKEKFLSMLLDNMNELNSNYKKTMLMMKNEPNYKYGFINKRTFYKCIKSVEELEIKYNKMVRKYK